MKTKLSIVAALAILCASAHGAAVDWSSAALSFGTTALKSNSSISAWLVYLDSKSFADSYPITDSFSPSDIGVVVASDTDGSSKASKVAGKAGQWTNLSYNTNGDTFGLVLSYNDGTKTWWNISSSLNAFSGLVTDDPTVAPADWNDFAVASTKNEANGTLSSSSGWTAAVPEPGTAALALLGIGMLIRRRRA